MVRVYLLSALLASAFATHTDSGYSTEEQIGRRYTSNDVNGDCKDMDSAKNCDGWSTIQSEYKSWGCGWFFSQPCDLCCEPGKNFYTKNLLKFGGWGGSCTCPDGSTYQVGDNQDACGSLACINGVPGDCNEELGEWSFQQAICADVQKVPIHEKLHELFGKVENGFDLEKMLKDAIEAGSKDEVKAKLEETMANIEGKVPEMLQQLLEDVLNGDPDKIGKVLTEMLMDATDEIQKKLQNLIDEGGKNLNAGLKELLDKSGAKIPKPLFEQLTGILDEGLDDAINHVQKILDDAFEDLDELIKHVGDKVMNFFFPNSGGGDATKNFEATVAENERLSRANTALRLAYEALLD